MYNSNQDTLTNSSNKVSLGRVLLKMIMYTRQVISLLKVELAY